MKRLVPILMLLMFVTGVGMIVATAMGADVMPHRVAQLPDAGDPAKFLIYFMALCVTALAGFIVKGQNIFQDKILLVMDEVMLEARAGRHAINNLSLAQLATKTEDVAQMKALVDDITNEPELNEARERLAQQRAKLGMKPRGSRNPQGKQ